MKTFFTDGDRNDDGPNSGNDCAIVAYDGYWEDEECDASHQFVCMWIKGKISSTYLHHRTSHKTLCRQSIVRDNIPRHLLGCCILFTDGLCATAPEIRNTTKTVDKLQFKITYRCADGFIASTGGSESTFICPCNGNWESVIADFRCEGMLA